MTERQTDEMPEQVSIDQAVQLAIVLHKKGYETGDKDALGSARTLYERVLEVVPEHPDALHYLALLLHHTGHEDRVVELMQRSLSIRPDANVFNNLGNIHSELGHADDALACWRKALELNPSDASAHCNVGTALRQRGDAQGAIRQYEEALRIHPEHLVVLENLGNVLQMVGRHADAVLVYRRLTTAQPDFPHRTYLAIALWDSGKKQEALEVIRDHAAKHPEDARVRHTLAGFTGEDVPDRMADAVVQQSFDTYAKNYDHHLVHVLHSKVPELILAAFESCLGQSRDLDIVDLGCGTGLCGPGLRARARRLVGVDLSGPMLELASKRNLYDELAQAELTAFLATRQAAYDVAISSDTMCYFGDLGEVCTKVASSLRPGGWFVFSVERTADGEGDTFKLHPHGRYSHHDGYLRRCLESAGFALQSLSAAPLREQWASPVPGWIVTARKAAL